MTIRVTLEIEVKDEKVYGHTNFAPTNTSMRARDAGYYFAETALGFDGDNAQTEFNEHGIRIIELRSWPD